MNDWIEILIDKDCYTFNRMPQFNSLLFNIDVDKRVYYKWHSQIWKQDYSNSMCHNYSVFKINQISFQFRSFVKHLNPSIYWNQNEAKAYDNQPRWIVNFYLNPWRYARTLFHTTSANTKELIYSPERKQSKSKFIGAANHLREPNFQGSKEHLPNRKARR